MLHLGRGASAAGLRDSTNVLADAVEALIAAVYLDVGLEAARVACERIVADELQALESDGTRDPKSELQERLQAIGGEAPTYELIETGGPAHKRWFKVGVRQGSDAWPRVRVARSARPSARPPRLRFNCLI